MKITRIFPIIVFIFIIACNTQSKDPNAQVDEGSVSGETYTSKEIGWTMQIPAGFTITSKDVVEEREKKGQKAIENAIQGQINTDSLKHLISFAKDRFNVFGSTSQPFVEEYPGHYQQTARDIAALIIQTFASQGIKIDTSTNTETIKGLDFHTLHTTIYSKEGKPVLRQILYSRLINGYDFSVNINYNNEDDKEAMVNAWKKSKFQ